MLYALKAQTAKQPDTSAVNKVLDIVPAYQDNQQLRHPYDYAALLNAYRSWVYICSNRNGNAFASVPLKLYVAKSSSKQKVYVPTKPVSKSVMKYMEGKANITALTCVRKSLEILEVEDHPLLTLISHVNPFMNRFELMDLTDEFQELTGNAYWYIVRNGLDVPVEIWLLSPSRVRVIPSKEKWIAGYIYTSIDGKEIPFTTDEIIHFRFPNPNNPFYGASPLQAMSDSYNINEQMNTYQMALLGNSAIPPVALIAPKDAVITESQYKQVLTRWNNTYGGARNQGKTAWLEMGFDIKPLAGSPKELAFLAGKKTTMTEICAAFGVPLSKVTTDAVGRANAESGDYQYMADTIRPRTVLIEERINERLVPMVDDSLFFMFDNCVPEDKEFIMKERESNLKSCMTVVNEERSKLGMESVEWGDKPIVSTGTGPMGAAPAVAPGQAGTPGKEQVLSEKNPELKSMISELLAGVIHEELEQEIERLSIEGL